MSTHDCRGLRSSSIPITVIGMTVDEVVASNIKRIREAKGLGRRDLADRLGVGLHLARDLERPRAGQPQRAFSWSELVALCQALETNLFDLVLPADIRNEAGEVELTADEITVDELDRATDSQLAAAARKVGADEFADMIDRPDRAVLGWILFGVDGRKLDPEGFREHVEKENARRRQVADALTPELLKRIRKQLREDL